MKIDKKLIIPHLFTVCPDRFMIENGFYWFTDNETDCDEEDKDLGRQGGGEPQVINYSWVWKDKLMVNYWSDTYVIEWRTNSGPWMRRERTERQVLSFTSVNTDTSLLLCVCVHVRAHTHTRMSNLSYRDRHIDQTQINRGQTGRDRAFTALVVE